MKKLTFVNDKDETIINLLLSQNLPYNTCQKALRNKDVKINGRRINKNIVIQSGSTIDVFYQQNTNKFDIMFQDENIFVVNKHSGIEVEGEDGIANSLNAIAVHRLDRNTTGLLLLAKNKASETSLLKAFKTRTITKKYLAIVNGKSNLDGKYSAYLVKDNKNSVVKIYDKCVANSVKITSIFKTLYSDNEKSLILCELVSGKTHQLRAHLAFLGHAIIGDGKYGKNKNNHNFKRQLLHCVYLRLEGLGLPLDYLNGKEFKSMPQFPITLQEDRFNLSDLYDNL